MKRIIVSGKRFGKTEMMWKCLQNFEYTQEEQAFIDFMVSYGKAITSAFQDSSQEIGGTRMEHGKEV